MTRPRISPAPLAYRPDIDGLRAVAILAVLGFHGFPSAVGGGFIGVDVFFVISGFLISTIIFRQLEGDRFSYTNFYQRRIRRIFPALLLLMAAVWGFGWLILFPDEFRQLGKHVAGGNGFISNLVLWNEAGYFDAASETKPLLHLWSLGIEEQFYILWPLSLGLLWKRRFNLLGITLCIAFASFVANLWAIHAQSAAAAYYIPTNRFWEMMIGGVLAYVSLHHADWLPRRSWTANILALLGVLMIAAGLVWIDRDTGFPGWWALLPTCGTALLIATPDAWFNRRVLARRVPVYIGLISYPLYLWHWSILSFAGILEIDSDLERGLSLVASGLLAVLTFELVEKAVKRSTHKALVPGLFAVSVLMIGLGLATFGGLIPPRNSSQGALQASLAIEDWGYPDGMTPETVDGFPVHVKVGAPGRVLFYGDSHMEQYAPRIVQLIDENPEHTRSAVFSTVGGCPPIPGVFKDQNSLCTKAYREAMHGYALSPEIEAVVIGFSSIHLVASEHRPGSDQAYYWQGKEGKVPFHDGGIALAFQSFEEFVTELARDKPVFLVIDNPRSEVFDPRTHFSGSRLRGTTHLPPAPQPFPSDQVAVRNEMLAIAARSGASVIDVAGAMCPDGLCPATMADGKPIYKDRDHIRPFYVREYLDVLDVTVRGDR